MRESSTLLTCAQYAIRNTQYALLLIVFVVLIGGRLAVVPASFILAPVAARVGGAVGRLAHRLGQARGLVGQLQAGDQLVQVAVQHARQVADRQLDAVVGHAVLWVVVGADLL